MDVFDPVLGNGCCTPGAKGITWHPIKTATNGQLALGMTRWIIENKAYNADYLGFTSYKAAVAGDRLAVDRQQRYGKQRK